MSAPKKASSNLLRAPRLVVDKERALKFWEESESNRASDNSNFFKTLRNNRTTIIVAIVAAALIFFRLQEATYKGDRRLKKDFNPEDDPFTLLGLKQGSSASEVKTAYMKLSLQLHPDKNPECKDCAAKFSKVAKAYRSLTHVGHKTDQVKDAANEQNEEEKDRKMMSDSASITDANYQQLMPAKAAWLVLFYSDNSDDSWDLHPTWERVVDELRELQALGVGRIDIDIDKAARRHFVPESDLHPPAIMYKGPDGSKKWYQGRPRSIDILEFVSNCMSAEVTPVDDLNYQSFLSDNEGLVRVMLFARDNNVKLYRVFNALSLQYPQIKFAVVAQAGASALEARYRTTVANKAIIVFKDRNSKPLKMASRLLYANMLRVLEPNKFPDIVAVTQSNVATMCDPPGGQPCVILVVPSVSEVLSANPAFAEFKAASVKATKMRRKFYLDKRDKQGNVRGQDMPWFAILDASAQPGVAAALGVNASAPLSHPLETSSRVVAYDGSQRMATIFTKENGTNHGAQSRNVLEWASTLAVTLMSNVSAALSPSDRSSLDKSAVTWAPVDIHSPSFSTWKSTTSYIVSIHRWLIKHRETLITVIIIAFCILVGIIWNDFESQKIQDKKKALLANSARPVALAAQAQLQKEEEEKESKRRLDEETRRAREQALKDLKDKQLESINSSAPKSGKKFK